VIDADKIETVLELMGAFLNTAGDEPLVEIRTSRISHWAQALEEALNEGAD
jgi:hypothetical protein